MKAYLRDTNLELEVRGFYNTYQNDAKCIMCNCFIRELDSCEEVPASMIEIRF